MRIGELAAASGTTPKTVRSYEDAELLPAPARTAGGYRDYGPEAVGRVRLIRRCRAAGLSLARVREVLVAVDVLAAGGPEGRAAAEVLDELLVDLDVRIASLRNVRDVLRDGAGLPPMAKSG